MDFDDSPAESTFREEVRAFLKGHLPADLSGKVLGHRRLHKEDFLRWQAILLKRGWVAPAWPKEHGGTGWSAIERGIFDEECALAGAPELPAFGVRMIGPVLIAFGTEAQKQHLLPRILDGSDWWCQGYSEPGAGSDLAALSTRAEIDGADFVVNGQKIWTTYAHYANMMFALVRTASTGKKQEGISFLLVDMTTPGITVRPIITLDGEHEINEVFFDNVRVPRANLVGELNQGWTCAKYLLGHERFGAARVGRAKREVAFLRRIATERIVDGIPLAESPAFAEKLARLEIDLMALECTSLRMSVAATEGAIDGTEASLLKLLGARVAQAASALALDVAGPYALPYRPADFELNSDLEPVGPDYSGPLAAYYMNLRKITIYGGTDEVQHNIIAKARLGL
ncbi:acyl-CoA dehydrogenase family protein [Aquabacter sp. L1I39]|uniref:acyl-CoA dehydrogenase family protein n=1 Tax=Aquabacter sp. L1I39 TaxID=2820278 RepID=UPI001AD9CF8A|nr:acyl-CoA dehydrogenase family protein [Aquabacter sp. L1I39]QTL04797.1 acyl-CoA dehydrogenase family protein [Aquabacter sp. L1I39]